MRALASIRPSAVDQFLTAIENDHDNPCLSPHFRARFLRDGLVFSWKNGPGQENRGTLNTRPLSERFAKRPDFPRKQSGPGRESFSRGTVSRFPPL